MLGYQLLLLGIKLHESIIRRFDELIDEGKSLQTPKGLKNIARALNPLGNGAIKD